MIQGVRLYSERVLDGCSARSWAGERDALVRGAPRARSGRGRRSDRQCRRHAAAKAYARQALAPETLRAYATDWTAFTVWCRAADCTPLPADPVAVAAYLAACAPGYSRAALERRLAAIGQQHRLRDLPWSAGHPALRTTLRGIFRQHGSFKRQATALTSTEIKRLDAGCGADLVGRRDRALLLLGFAGALRRPELVGVHREHLRFTEKGLRLRLSSSKTDPEGRGTELGIVRGKRVETCPVRALEAWLTASECVFRPMFRKIDLWGHIEHRRLGAGAPPWQG